MPAKVFCLASPKGGSGKTIITATLAAFLINLQKKVLIIDADAATNGLTLFYLDEIRQEKIVRTSQNKTIRGIFEVKAIDDKNSSIEEKVPNITILNNQVHLIPSSYEFKDTETVPKPAFRWSLKETILALRYNYDYIFLDSQAGSDDCAKICMSKEISDEVIIVSEFDPISNSGIQRIRALLNDNLSENRMWILYNKILPEIAEAALGDYLKVDKYLPPIPWDADVVKSYTSLKLALDLENGNEYTLAIIRVIRSLLGNQISAEIENWINNQSAIIRQPINKQYDDLELQFKNILNQIEIVNKKRRLTIIRTSFIAGFAIIIFVFLILMFFALFSAIFAQLTKSSGFGFLIGFVTLLVTLILMSYFSNASEKDPTYQLEMSRLKRQQNVIEEKLKKLEALKTADLETLVKAKKLG